MLTLLSHRTVFEDAFLNFKDDPRHRKPLVREAIFYLTERHSAIPYDRLQVIILPAGLRVQLYDQHFAERLGHIRSAPCGPCLRLEVSCVQTNGESWKCRECLLHSRSPCEWQVETGMY